MNYGYRTYDGTLYSERRSKEDVRPTECSLLIRNCAALPRHMQSGVRELHNLHTPAGSRKKGLAKHLVALACAEADASNLSLVLLVSEDGRANLVKFYKSFSFETAQNDDKAFVMVRSPRISDAR